MVDDNTQGRMPEWSPDAGSGWYVIPDDVPRDQLPEEIVQGLEALEVRERERQEQLNRQLELLAQRVVLPEQDLDFEPGPRQLKDVVPRQLFETRYASLQPPLWALGDGEWLKVVRVAEAAPRKQRVAARQYALPMEQRGG